MNDPMNPASPLHVRLATPDDLPAINDIYNHYVLHSTATYQEQPEPMEARRAWFERRGPEHPVTVAQRAGRIVGWGSIGAFHPRSAYRRTVENALYVHPDHHRQGVGRALLSDLIDRATAQGHHTILALIDAGQSPSIALHAAFAFTPAARLHQVGHKFGRWLDVVYMQLMLEATSVSNDPK